MQFSTSLVNALNDELSAAGEGLVGNDDVLRAVLAASGDCIKILDLDGRLQFMSEGGKRVMEVEDFGRLKGCPWPDFWADSGNAEARRAVEAAQAGNSARFTGAADTAKGTPRHWDVQVSPIFDHTGEVSHILSISRDITKEWQAFVELEAASLRQSVLTAELEHRIKNMFAMVGAIAHQTIRGDVDEARKTFSSRLITLSHAHDILTKTSWESAPVGDVVTASLRSHGAWASRIEAAGPYLALIPNRALALALALHELATNAVKYGALSNETGRVRIEWSSGPEFKFTWTESGGPEIAEPVRASKSFGSRLLEGVLANAFQGKVALSYRPTGLVCEVTAPLSE